MSRIYLTIEEIRKKFEVDEVVLMAKSESQDTSGNFLRVDILYIPPQVFININQRDDKFYKDK